MCGVCERIQMTREGRNPYFVKELETGYVVIGDFQHFKGYTLFIYKEHVVELFDLAPAVRAKHLEEMTLVAKAVRDAFGAGKMNYECLGNGTGGAHIHWHLFPRRAGDLGDYGNNGKGPAWWYPREKMYDDSTRPDEQAAEGAGRAAGIKQNGGSRPSVLHITPVENSLPGQRHNLRALIYADIVHFKFCREAFLVCPFAAAPGSAPGKIHQQMHALVKRPYA